MATEHDSWIKGLGVNLEGFSGEPEGPGGVEATATTPAALFKLKVRLALEEAGVLDAAGGLTPLAIQSAKPVPLKSEIGNQEAIKALTAGGRKIENWGKFTTKSVEVLGRGVQVHFYKSNSGEVDYSYERDFKVKGVEKVFDAHGTELRKKDLKILNH
jgi:hypothetical protein